MRKFLFYLLLFLLLLLGALWWNLDRLTQQVVRPWLVSEIGQALQADVSIDSLALDWPRLLVRQLRLVGKDGFEAGITEIEIRFSVKSLLQMRLEEMIVRRPEVQVRPAMSGAEQSATAGDLPELVPLHIDRWVLEAGSLQLVLPDRTLALHEIAAQGSLGTDFTFGSQALFGDDPAVAFQVRGTGQWQKGLAITLTELVWDGQSLLPEEVTFKPAQLSDSGIHLAFDRLESSAVEALLDAAGEPTPWPQGMHWQVTEPDLAVLWSGQDITLHVTTQKGFVKTAESLWPWQQIEMQATGHDIVWSVSAAIDLAGSSRLQATGEWRDQAFLGEGQFSSQKPAELARQMPLKLPVGFDRISQLSVQTRFRAAARQLEIPHGRLDVQISEVGLLQGTFNGQWQDGAATAVLDRLTLSSPSGRLLAESSLRLSGKPETDKWSGEWSFASVDPLTLAALAGLVLPEEIPRLGDLKLSGKLAWQDHRLALTGVSMHGNLNGGGMSAVLSGGMDLQGDSRAAEISLRQISLDKLEYSNAAGTAVVTGGRLGLAGSLRFARQQFAFNLNGRSSFSEALLGSWYGELSKLPVNFSAQGGWEVDDERLRLDAVELDLAGLAVVDLQGDVSSERMKLQAGLEIEQLAGDFQKTLQRLGADLVPGIEQLGLAGGISAEAALETQRQDWSFRLLVQPRDVTFRWGDSLRMTGLRGRFPVLLESGANLPDSSSVNGALQWNELNASLVKTGHGRLQMEASANRWRLKEPLELTSAGGLVRLKQFSLTMEELVPRALASMQVSNLDLAQLTGSFGWPEMTGRFNASLEDVRFSQTEITTVGEASAEAFGGSLQLRNLRIEAPLSRFPTYHADVDFTGFDLHELTQTFEFGEINGIADGFVHNLRLFDGTPSAFDAQFETRSEGTRSISVKAIRNLNTLSQGGLSAALSQGIYQFIDFYRFRKIGIHCSLRNDQFHVRGVAREGSEKVLVDGGLLPPKIDVIISSPTISFKEMLQRLKRIDRTGR